MGYLIDHLEKLPSLMAIEEKGSIRKAATDLRMTQPALSRQIQMLENVLGFSLLDRSRTGVSLTEQGKRLSQFARKLLQEAEQLETSLKGGAETVSFLRIGTFDSLSIRVWPQLIPRLRAVFPETRLGVRTGDTGELFEGVVSGELDCALTMLESYAPRSLFIKEIFTDSYGFFASPQFARLPGADFAPEAISDIPLILVSGARCKMGDTISELLADSGFLLKQLLPVDTFEAAANYAREGLGIAVLPYVIAKPSLRKQKLCPLFPRVFPKNEFGLHRMGLVWRKDSQKNKTMETLERLLLDFFSEA